MLPYNMLNILVESQPFQINHVTTITQAGIPGYSINYLQMPC